MPLTSCFVLALLSLCGFGPLVVFRSLCEDVGCGDVLFLNLEEMMRVRGWERQITAVYKIGGGMEKVTSEGTFNISHDTRTRST